MEFTILVVDDNSDDRFFFKKALYNSNLQAQIAEADSGASCLHLVKKNQYDCIFLDYHLPGIDGLDLLRMIRNSGVDTPVVMLTGQKDEKVIVKLIQAGAEDYLSKDSLSPDALRLSIENARRLYKVRKEKREMEKALRLSESRLAEAQKIALIGNWEYDFSTHKFFLSNEAFHVLEYDNKTTLNFFHFSRKVHDKDILILRESIRKLKSDPVYDLTFRIHSGNSNVKHIHARGHVTYNEEGKIDKIVGTVQDITLLKNALLETMKATVRSKATSIVFGVAILLFLVSEAVLDPFVEAFSASLLISLSFKGTIALILKPVEGFLAKIMIGRII